MNEKLLYFDNTSIILPINTSIIQEGNISKYINFNLQVIESLKHNQYLNKLNVNKEDINYDIYTDLKNTLKFINFLTNNQPKDIFLPLINEALFISEINETTIQTNYYIKQIIDYFKENKKAILLYNDLSTIIPISIEKIEIEKDNVESNYINFEDYIIKFFYSSILSIDYDKTYCLLPLINVNIQSIKIEKINKDLFKISLSLSKNIFKRQEIPNKQQISLIDYSNKTNLVTNFNDNIEISDKIYEYTFKEAYHQDSILIDTTMNVDDDIKYIECIENVEHVDNIIEVDKKLNVTIKNITEIIYEY